MLPRSSARVGLTRFCFLLLCGSGQRPSWLFESVTSHFAFIRSSFTLSISLNTFACSVSHMTSLVLMLSCQGSHLALVRRRGTHSFRGCLSTCLSQRVLLAGYGYIVLLSSGFCKCFFAHFALSAFCTVWSGLHCASCYSVGKRTWARLGWACVCVWQGSQGCFWGALGAFRGWGGIGHGGGCERAHRGLYGLVRGSGRVGLCTARSGATSGARVDAHRGAGRVVWSGLGWGRWARSGAFRGWTGARTA